MTASLAAPPAAATAADQPEVSPGNVVTLRDGLPGFEQCRRFVVIASEDIDPLVQLRALDGSRPSFLALDPRRVHPDYDTQLSAADRGRLDADAGDVLLWLAIVRVEERRLLVNLRAPVVINPRRMLGLQVVAPDSPYDTEYVLQVD